jgi:YfiH family protein
MAAAEPSEATTEQLAGKRARGGDVALVPEGWSEFAGLVCGFGGRDEPRPGEPLAMLTQVHGNLIVAAEEVMEAAGDVNADGLSVMRSGLTAAIRTADCVPLLLVAPAAGWAAVVHAGWRGTVGDIAGEAVRAAGGQGIAAAELYAAIGPAIGPCCYEVGEEVASRFDEQQLAVDRSASKPVLDLRAINRRLLLDAGLSPERVQLCGPCTRCRCDLYWSHRADPQNAGRQLSWIGWANRRPSTDP